MKKFMFLLVAALMSTAMSFGQSTLVATLSHGDEITMYYGAYALRDAVNAAASGDVINLSGGAFQAVQITKGISLRGTGIDDVSPTYVLGDFIINVSSEDTNRLSVEGIRFSGEIHMEGTFNNPYFVKSAFYYIDYRYGAAIKSATYANCKISKDCRIGGTSTAQFINCVLNQFSCESSSASLLSNCVIQPNSNGYYASDIQSTQLLNCIIYQTEAAQNLNNPLPSTSIATNCVSIGNNGLFSANAANTGNTNVGYNEYDQVFKDFTGAYTDAQKFELTDAAKTAYLGTDGTEVGIYGGLLPYDSTPSYPLITKMNVANKTTADGKLSVEIEVSATE